jgi:hypothetical protein
MKAYLSLDLTKVKYNNITSEDYEQMKRKMLYREQDPTTSKLAKICSPHVDNEDNNKRKVVSGSPTY